MRYIAWLEEITKSDFATAGGKATHLAQMMRADFAVPISYVITTDATREILARANIGRLLKQVSKLSPSHHREIVHISKQIQKVIRSVTLPKRVEKAIHLAFMNLERKTGKRFFVVRSSTNTEYIKSLSFAGQHRPIFNIETFTDLKKATLEALAGLYQDDTLYYSLIHGLNINALQLAIIVQPMLDSQVSGVLMTVNPLVTQSDTMIVEAGWGLGLATSTGEITPDRYELEKGSYSILQKQIATQKWMLAVRSGKLKHVSVSKEKQSIQKLDDSLLLELASLGKQAEELFGYPQDLEWAIEAEKIWLVHARPILYGKASTPTPVSVVDIGSTEVEGGQVLVRGIPSSIGISSGPVVVMKGDTDPETLPDHAILVVEVATPGLAKVIQKVGGVVTDTGGMTTHAAILAREAGVPCIVGTGDATRMLIDGQLVTVDGFHGLVYQGKVHPPAIHEAHRLSPRPSIAPARSTGSGNAQAHRWITGTKVYLNLANPDRAHELANLSVDGVGLIRAEFLLSNLGEHPKAIIDRGGQDHIVHHLYSGLSTIAKAFSPRPVIYRTSDFKTNEYRQLAGGDHYEPVEPNPTLGYRGVRRYLDDPALFQCELKAIGQVRSEHNLTNLWIIYPFVRTPQELGEAMRMTAEAGLVSNRDFKIWMMIETPGNIFALDTYCQAGIQGVSIGSNDLTQLILGIDRDNSRLADYFDERDPAVLKAMIEVVKTTRRYHLTCSICGTSASMHPEVVEALIEAGITSVSVTPDVAEETKRLVASIERRILLERALSRD